MLYNILGKTNLKVSVIGLGGIPLQRLTKEDAKKVVDLCIDEGINFFDSARGYTVSEELFGDALCGRRDRFVIATKSMARSYDAMKADIDISLKNLKTDRIDIYQLHNPRSQQDIDQIFSENGALKALLEAKKDGKIQNIGVTSHKLDTLRIMMEKFDFDTVMFPYNIVETQAEEDFKKWHAKNVGIIVMKPLAGGNIEKPVLALKYVLSNQCVSTAIPGMATTEEVLCNSAAARGAILTEKDEKNIKQIREELGSDFCRRCDYCQPCPQGIDISSCQTFFNYTRKYGLAEWAVSRYNGMAKNAKDCVACKMCETRCPYDLKIVDKLKNIKEGMEKLTKDLNETK